MPQRFVTIEIKNLLILSASIRLRRNFHCRYHTVNVLKSKQSCLNLPRQDRKALLNSVDPLSPTMVRCAVRSCDQSQNKRWKRHPTQAKPKKVSFYAFPRDPEIRAQWRKFSGQGEDFNFDNARVCGNHFLDSDFDNLLKYTEGYDVHLRLRKDAVPSVLTDKQSKKMTRSMKQKADQERKKYVEQILENFEKTQSTDQADSIKIENVPCESPTAVEPMTAVFISDAPVRRTSKEASPEIGLMTIKTEEEELTPGPILSTTRVNPPEPNADYADLVLTLDRIRTENFVLLAKNDELREEKTQLQEELKATRQDLCAIETKLRELFTEHQIGRMKWVDAARKQWTSEDCAKSMLLYKSNSAVYKFLRSKDFPLPAVRTLQKWAETNDYMDVIKTLNADENKTKAGDDLDVIREQVDLNDSQQELSSSSNILQNFFAEFKKKTD